MASIRDAWSADEDDFLRSNYFSGAKVVDICNKLPGRTYDAVCYRLKVLGIQGKREDRKYRLPVDKSSAGTKLNADLDIVRFRHWEEQEMLHCDGLTVSDCMEIFKNRTRYEIKLLSRKMGVSLVTEKQDAK